MAKKPLPDPELLRQLIDYNPDTGMMIWRERPVSLFNAAVNKSAEADCLTWNKRFAGKPAMQQLNGDGYQGGNILGSDVRAHRLIWALVTGAWPKHQIDHINGDKADNSWSNLREVNNQTNCKNQKLRETNTSGHNGVFWMKSANKWAAKVGREYLGVFPDKESAISARLEANSLNGYTKRHGKMV